MIRVVLPYHLRNLASVGDEVQVESADGSRVTYVVDRAAEYSKGQFPTAEVFGATMDDQLRLITCTGPWDSLAQSYSGNRKKTAGPSWSST